MIIPAALEHALAFMFCFYMAYLAFIKFHQWLINKKPKQNWSFTPEAVDLVMRAQEARENAYVVKENPRLNQQLEKANRLKSWIEKLDLDLECHIESTVHSDPTGAFTKLIICLKHDSANSKRGFAIREQEAPEIENDIEQLAFYLRDIIKNKKPKITPA